MNLQTQVPVGKITRNIDACRGYHGEARDTEDQKRLRQARERDVGFAVGQYPQPVLMLFTRDGHNVFWATSTAVARRSDSAAAPPSPPTISPG